MLRGPENKEIRLRGAYLDLQIKFAGGKLEKFGPPKLISSIDALAVFAETEAASRAFMPINLSRLSERVVETALRAPPLSRGSHWQRKKLGKVGR